ncbi:unnamed protein product [Soboliphyme baturini]|uniref:Secreted protein n=1 Tax=Soboliphyme baturini TaxID=241478 RepID=A0A183IQY9_9BILA|nr:unnamed protein product [Soboliphyme baturini]
MMGDVWCVEILWMFYGSTALTIWQLRLVGGWESRDASAFIGQTNFTDATSINHRSACDQFTPRSSTWQQLRHGLKPLANFAFRNHRCVISYSRFVDRVSPSFHKCPLCKNILQQLFEAKFNSTRKQKNCMQAEFMRGATSTILPCFKDHMRGHRERLGRFPDFDRSMITYDDLV